MIIYEKKRNKNKKNQKRNKNQKRKKEIKSCRVIFFLDIINKKSFVLGSGLEPLTLGLLDPRSTN